VRARITSGGGEPGGGPAEAFARQVRADFERWGAVVRANNIRAE
jgi:hypothetical protein